MRKVITYNILFTFTALLLIEVTFGTWLRPNRLGKFDLLRNFDGTYAIGKLYPNIRGQIHYKRDAFGLRGGFPNPASIEILTVGGSTTDQRYITEGETWQDHLASELSLLLNRPIYVANAGVDGRSTFGHIKDLESWFPAIRGLRPQWILFYIGNNDLYSSMEIPQDQLGKKDVSSTIKASVQDNSAFFQMILMIQGNYLAKQVYPLGHVPTDFSKIKWTDISLLRNHRTIIQKRAEAFRARLEILITKTKEMGSKPIFVTQTRSTFRKEGNHVLGMDLPLRWVDGMEVNGVDEYYLLGELNRQTLEVCKASGVICFDLAKELPFLIEDFYDYLHNTPSGAKKTGAYLAERLLPLLKSQKN